MKPTYKINERKDRKLKQMLTKKNSPLSWLYSQLISMMRQTEIKENENFIKMLHKQVSFASNGTNIPQIVISAVRKRKELSVWRRRDANKVKTKNLPQLWPQWGFASIRIPSEKQEKEFDSYYNLTRDHAINTINFLKNLLLQRWQLFGHQRGPSSVNKKGI